MLKPQAAIEFIKSASNNQSEVWLHELEFYPSQSYNMERSEGWYYTVSYAADEPGAVSQKAWFAYDKPIQQILDSNYDETDRIDDIFVEDNDLFISVNHGNVGSGAIMERYGLGKFAKLQDVVRG